MNTLINSSDTTLLWISRLKEIIEERNLPLIYKEFKYWASFKNTDRNRNRNIVYLHPTKNQIRLFTKLDQNDNNLLEPTPSTHRWAQNFPSIFTIRNEDMILYASKLIIESYTIDLHI
jgi:hypothetical protein